MSSAAIAEAGRGEPLVRWRGPVPSLSLAALDGTRVALGKPRGNILIVHFFATWCETCRPELVALDRLKADFKSRLTVLAVDVGEPQIRVRRYFRKLPVAFRIGLDPDRAAARAWGVHALPATFILDRAHAPRWRATGDVAWDEPAIRRLLTADMSNNEANAKP